MQWNESRIGSSPAIFRPRPNLLSHPEDPHRLSTEFHAMSKKPKKKLTAAQRAAKKQRKKDFMTVFMNGKQVRVRRPPTIDGMDAEEFIRHNADPIWLHQYGDFEILNYPTAKKKPSP